MCNLISQDEMLKHIKYICKKYPNRIAGSEIEKNAAYYIGAEFEKSGAEVSFEEFPVLEWKPYDAKLSIYTPIKESIKCCAMPYSPSCEIRGELKFVGLGFEDKDYIDAEGKIALIELCPYDVTEDKTQYLRAVRNNVKAVIFFNSIPKTDIRIFPIVETQNWNMKTGKRPTKPILSISYENGIKLVGLLKKAKVELEISIKAEVIENAKSVNVIGTIEGAKFPDEVVLVTAHHDCWFEGANDNIASVCMLFEIIKVFKKYKPLRTMKFVSFGAEEIGALEFCPWLWTNGSKFFADSDLNIVGVLNNELLGAGDALSVQGTGAEIRKVILDTADVLKLKKKYKKIDTWHAFINSDHYPFTLKGIPTAQFSGKSALTQYKNYHTSTDTPEDIHEETLMDLACLAASSGFFLSHSLFLPYDLSVCFDELLNGNTELKARGLIQMNKDSVINLDKLIELLHRQKDLSDELCEIKNSLEKIYTGNNKEIEKYASKMNKKILEIIKKINLNSYHSVAYGEYGLHIVPIIIQMFPSLQALEDLYFTKKAIESLKDKNLSGTLNNLRNIYPYKSLSNGIEFYPPRFMPEYDLDLPFINPKEEIFSLENKKESNYEREILSLTKKYETTKNLIKKEIDILYKNLDFEKTLENLIKEGKSLLKKLKS